MKPVKTVRVLGERVDIFTNGKMTNGASAFVIQTTSPGGGPPPHKHTKEDETFSVLEGEFEVLDHGEWRSAPRGEFFFSPRGSIHTFRNCGTTVGRMAVFIAPAGFEEFFEQMSGLTPADMPKIVETANKFGLTFHL
jgi:quercetin dioxygenase-like cupin family protein